MCLMGGYFAARSITNLLWYGGQIIQPPGGVTKIPASMGAGRESEMICESLAQSQIVSCQVHQGLMREAAQVMNPFGMSSSQCFKNR
jgi:hypothetical protein